MIALVHRLKRLTGARTWQIEACFAGVVLGAVAFTTSTGWRPWLGAAAVFVTFLHATVADRLAEGARSGKPVPCHEKAQRYFMAKEALWVAYFMSLRAWAPLIGCALFLAYPAWRAAWRGQERAS